MQLYASYCAFSPKFLKTSLKAVFLKTRLQERGADFVKKAFVWFG
jgi:hypothetical protein